MQAEKINLIETVAFQLVQKIFESYSFVEKVRLELKNLGPCSLAIRDLFADNRTREKRAFLLGLAPLLGDKQLQLGDGARKIKDEAFAFFRHPQGLKQNLGRSGAGHLFESSGRSWNLDDPRGFTRDPLTIEQEMGRAQRL